MAAAGGGGALLKHLLRRYGLIGGPLRLVGMVKSFAKPFGGFAANTFFSAAPIASGAYAVRVRLVPAESNGDAVKGAQADWNAEFSGRLKQGDLQWELQLQPYVNEELTPIEDASVNWPNALTPP